MCRHLPAIRRAAERINQGVRCAHNVCMSVYAVGMVRDPGIDCFERFADQRVRMAEALAPAHRDPVVLDERQPLETAPQRLNETGEQRISGKVSRRLGSSRHSRW